MGIQPVGDVDLIRHAYVSPGSQRRGVGGALLEHLARSTTRRMLVGTWAAAEWAIRFYRHHGFELVSPERKAALLKAVLDHPGAPDRDLGRTRQSAARRGMTKRSSAVGRRVRARRLERAEEQVEEFRQELERHGFGIGVML